MSKIYVEPVKDKDTFASSSDYWETRYKNGGNSGSGSYNKLAEFKAEVVNEFIRGNGIKSCIEWGCGDGNQLSLMNYEKYLGTDISKEIIERNREKFKDDKSKTFMVNDENISIADKYDLAVSLDVIFHLVEDEVYDKYMTNLFKYAKKYVCVYSSNEDSEQCGYYNHMKHRKFTDWIEKNTKFKLIKYVPNRYPYDVNDCGNTSFCDFYFFKKVSVLDRLFGKN